MASKTTTEHLTDVQLMNLVKPITHVIDELRGVGEEARIRILAGVACFFNVQEEVIERIERAGRTTAKLVATGTGPKRG